ncbi:LOW QUALITY PROTEIN: hypothetical protein HID58_088709, partial [Brassica napus]
HNGESKADEFLVEIDNFWEKVDLIRSPIFLSGGCEWFVGVFPKGRNVEDHYLSVYLSVPNPETLRLGWKRRASFSFILQAKSSAEALNSVRCSVLTPRTGVGQRNCPLKSLKKKGSLEKSKLIVKVEIQVHEVVDEGGITGKEMVDYLGFRILYSQFAPVYRLFKKHQDIAANFRQSNQFDSIHESLLLGVIKTLNKPPHCFTDTELSNARSEYLTELRQAGFKVEWLKTKLDEISLERKKANAHVQEPDDEHIKVELKTKLVRSWNGWKVKLGYSRSCSL